ncbi:MAG: cellulase family glycosylhydrolase, partial [Xanthobacteraceae bacterium]|nr:cellulase family glycosylhydrolase [Xanthobacteraceae bacterium]
MAITYTVGNDWGSGFTGSMTVPGGSQGLNGWTLAFDAGFDITNIWNAVIVSHVGNHYVIQNAPWNANVPAGGQASFGFQATESASGTTATGFNLNGTSNAPPPVVPTLSVADASITESSNGTGQLSFTVTLSQAATSAVTVHYATADGTAKAGTDYNALSGTLTFAPGQTTQTISVPILADSLAAPSESFTLALTAPSGATLARAAAAGTILHDAPPVAGAASLAYTVTSNWGSGFNGAMTVTAGSSALTGWTVEFDSTASITNIWNATIVSHVGNHYVVSNAAYNGQVAAGQSASFGFQASGGTAASGFMINGVPAGGGAPPPPTLPTLSLADASVLEGNSGTSDLAFTVSLSATSTTPVTVAYATADGTATAGSDYTAATGTLTFAPGQTSQLVHIKVAGDTTYEANETLTLSLSNPSGATLAHGTATGTILNDDAPPSVSISNASFAEGSAGSPGQGSFTVSLSAASGLPLTVHYATQDGTALAGKDYVAQSGTLTFAPGQTQQTIQVSATGDAIAAAESFNVVLSNPTGGTIAQGIGTGTIQAASPALSINNTTVIEGGTSGGGALSGPLSTVGNQIVNSAGQSVEIAGVNWFGLESTNMSPDGLWARNYKDMMNQMVQLGFNTIRLPFSSEMLHSTAVASGINYSLNPDLQGLTGLQVMDKIVQYADQIGIKIILDHHRSEAGDGTSANGLWYDSQYSQAQWVSDWQMLAQRYANDSSVIGADLHNEPYNGTWGDGGVNDWVKASEQAGNAIGQVNPNWLVFVEGIGTYNGQSYWWGGNLMGVKDHPVVLNEPNKLVYSAHDYPNSVYPQPWFQAANYPANLPSLFTQMWGYIYQQNIAPVWVGEFGTKLTDPKDAPWLKALTAYMGGDFNNDGTSGLAAGKKGISWTYWSWNPNSGDTGGILADDWTTVNTAKLTYLQPIEQPIGSSSGGGSSAANFLVTLSAPASQTITVDYHTVAGTATTADFTPSSGTLTFAPGQQSQTISVPITADTENDPNEQFTVVLTNAQGATLATATGTATILDSASPSPPPTPTPSPTPTPVPAPSPSPSTDLQGQFSATNIWNGGFQGNVTVTNDGSAVTAWQIEIDMPYQITNIWNAQIISQNANGYIIGNASWDGTLAQGASTSFGFTANGALTNTSIQIYGVTAAAAAAALSSGSPSNLTAGIAVSDTAANVSANLAGLQHLAAAGELTSITLTDPGTPKLTLTAAQVGADATALGKIASLYAPSLTGTAADFSNETVANFNVAGSALDVTNMNFAKLSATFAENANATAGVLS